MVVRKNDKKKINIVDEGPSETQVNDDEKVSSKKSGGVRKKEADKLKEKITELESEKEELQERALRIQAETENFKKRIEREKDDFAKYSNEKVVKELLPVLDNLERAVDHAKESKEEGPLLEGVEMTLELFDKALEKLGVSPVLAIGEPFNPEKHEAVQQIESGDHAPNIVVSEFQKGYMLHERLLRPAMVVVSKPLPNKNEN